jgi:hypothetical protein
MPLAITLLLLLAACGTKPAEVVTTDSTPWRKPGDAVDSILPMPEYLRRFRTGTDSVTTLAGGAPTREALARRFLEAVATRDSVTLSQLLVSRAEFGWLVFPDHIYAAPPYELDPAVFWMQLVASSAKGSARVLERVGGQPLAFVGLDCQRDTLQLRQVPATLWGPCTIRYRQGDSTAARRLFGSIIERDGVAKFLGYANEF